MFIAHCKAERYSPYTIRAYERVGRVEFMPVFGSRLVTEVTELDVQRLKVALGDLAPGSVNQALNALITAGRRWVEQPMLSPTMITDPFWLAPVGGLTALSFAAYLRTVLDAAPPDALAELRAALALRAGPVFEQLPFRFHEIVRVGDRRRASPPRALWPNTVAPLLLGCLLRRLVVGAGARGLAAVALYRPSGGATHSRHKEAAALDVRLLDSDKKRPELRRAMACAAAWVYRNGGALRVSVGTYRSGDEAVTVHLDAGRERRRCWQYAGAIRRVHYGEVDAAPRPERPPTAAWLRDEPWGRP